VISLRQNQCRMQSSSHTLERLQICRSVNYRLSSNSQSCSASGGVIVISSTCLYNFSLDTGDLVLLAKEQAVLQAMSNRLN
jgi:hypothetical protein